MRHRLLRRYAFFLLGMVSAILIVTGAMDLFAVYGQSISAAARLQRVEARRAAERVGAEFERLGFVLSFVGDAEQPGSETDLKLMRDEAWRALRREPAIAWISYVDGNGTERLRVARQDLDRQVPFSEEQPMSHVELPVTAVTERAVIVSEQTALPQARIMVRNRGRHGGVMRGELNLRGLEQQLRSYRVGRTGQTYVLDEKFRLIMHSDSVQGLRHPEVASLHQIAQIRDAWRREKEEGGGFHGAQLADGTNFSGNRIMASGWPVPGTSWLVVVEQDADEVLEPTIVALRRSASALVVGILLSLAGAVVLARRLTRPIIELEHAVSRLTDGDLSARTQIRTEDELQRLSEEFNSMATELESLYTDLESRVATKTAELEAANRHKSEFLANMSHELRTPLNAIIGFSEALAARYFGELNAKQTEYVGDIHASGLHLLSLINDLLDLSKVEAGRMDLEPSTFDLADLVKSTAILLRERALVQGVTIRNEVTEDFGLCIADARRLKQVLLNLLSNAVKFTSAGGLVKIGASREGHIIRISVSDTGIGIAPEQVDRIFDAFHQITPGAAGGTGLGLTLSRRFVELHGGEISLESEPGRGSTFTFTLPQP